MAFRFAIGLALIACAEAQVVTNTVTVLPKSDDSAVGSIKFRELLANGLDPGSLVGPASMEHPRTWTLPNYSTTLIGGDNYVYGSGAGFFLAGYRARGTEDAKSAVVSNDILFQFLGNAWNGSAWLNTAAINIIAQPPGADIAFMQTDGSGSFGERWRWTSAGHIAPASIAQQDIGNSTARLRTVYAKEGEFYIPGSADNSWIRSQNIEIIDNNGGSGKWRFKGFANTLNKYMWLEDPNGNEYIRCNLLIGGSNVVTCQAKTDWFPYTDLGQKLGSASLRWSDLFTNHATGTGTFQAHRFNLDTTSPSATFQVNNVTIVDANRNAAFNDLLISGTCTGCGGGGSGALGEVKITDHGATSNCSSPTSAHTAFAAAKAALPVDASGFRSGIITFPAGCYGWNLATAGPMLIDRSAGDGDITIRGAGPGGEYAAVGAGTEIRVIGSAPGASTPMAEIRYDLGGAIENIQFNAAGVSNTAGIKIKQTRFGRLENVMIRRWTNGYGVQFDSDSASYGGSCENTLINVVAVDVRDADSASGIDFDGHNHGRSACSNRVYGGKFYFSKSGASTRGIHWRYADNNSLHRTNVWASDCTAFPCESNPGSGRTTGTRPAIQFEQYSTDVGFPKENYFQGTPVSGNAHLIEGVSGVGGNTLDFTVDDCGGMLVGCFPATVRNLRGSTSYGQFQAKATFPINDQYQPMLTLDQSNGGFTTGGRLNLSRQDRVLGAIGVDSNLGMVLYSAGVTCQLLGTVGRRSVHATANSLTSISVSGGLATATMASSHGCATGIRVRVTESTTSALNGEFTVTGVNSTQLQWSSAAANGTYNTDGLTIEIAPAPLWSLGATGGLAPITDAVGQIGTISLKPAIVYSRSFQSYTANSLGTQTHSLISDADLNFSLSAYGSSGTNFRPAFFLDRGRGSVGSPTAVEANDRLGVFVFRGQVTGGLTNGALVESYVVARSSNLLSADLRFTTTNFSTQNVALQLLSSGAASFLSTVDATTYNATGNPAYRVGGTTVIDSSRNGTFNNITVTSCTGCGSSSFTNVIPSLDRTYNLGSSSFMWNNLFIGNGQVQVYGTTSVLRGSMSGGTWAAYDGSGSQTFSLATTSGALAAAGTISASSGFIAFGNTGITTNVTVPCGILSFVGGLLISKGACP